MVGSHFQELVIYYYQIYLLNVFYFYFNFLNYLSNYDFDNKKLYSREFNKVLVINLYRRSNWSLLLDTRDILDPFRHVFIII